MPVYEDMRAWVVDRQKAQMKLDKAETVYEQMTQEKYIEWLDSEKPEWLNDMEPPPEAA